MEESVGTAVQIGALEALEKDNAELLARHYLVIYNKVQHLVRLFNVEGDRISLAQVYTLLQQC